MAASCVLFFSCVRLSCDTQEPAERRKPAQGCPAGDQLRALLSGLCPSLLVSDSGVRKINGRQISRHDVILADREDLQTANRSCMCFENVSGDRVTVQECANDCPSQSYVSAIQEKC